MQSFIALTLLKAEQTWVEDEKQTWKIFINIAQNKDNHQSVSNLYWQFIHNKTHFRLKMYYLFDKTCVQHWKSAKISNLKKKKCLALIGLKYRNHEETECITCTGTCGTTFHPTEFLWAPVALVQTSVQMKLSCSLTPTLKICIPLNHLSDDDLKCRN